MLNKIKCLEGELTAHIKIASTGKNKGMLESKKRLCNKRKGGCGKPLSSDRWVLCTRCKPELGEELSDNFRGGLR